MRPSLTSALLLVALALLGLLWWSSRGAPAPLPHDAPTLTNDTPPTFAPPSAALPTPPTPDAPTNARTEIPAPPTVAPAIVRGRCVDTEARPIAGVTLRLDGRPNSSPPPTPPNWQAPTPLTTSDDGRFEFQFAPPPHFAFTLNAARAGAVPLTGHWRSLAPGSVTDLGDVTMHTGTRVAGRVVDREGRPVANISVNLAPVIAPAPSTLTQPNDPFDITASKADGTFRIRRLFRAGAYTVTTTGAVKVSPTTPVEVTGDEVTLDIVVEAPPLDVELEGIVVDERNEPVAGARLFVDEIPPTSAVTLADGTFRIRHRRFAPSAALLGLTIESPELERLTTPKQFHPGEKGIRVVVRRGLEFEVVVRRADDRAPVEEFGVYLQPVVPTGSVENQLRGGLRHENGIAKVSGLRRGNYLLSVTTVPPSSLAAVHHIPVRIDDDATRTIEVLLHPLVERAVVVTNRDGAAVADAKVELLHQSPDHALTRRHVALDVAKWGNMSGHGATSTKALLVQTVTTATDGTCTLQGMATRPFVVRVTAPAHPPHVVRDVRLDDPTPLAIVIPSGATLRGRVVPLDAIGDLRELAGLPRELAPGANPEPTAPRIRLNAPTSGSMLPDTWPQAKFGTMETFLGSAGVAIGADGTFELTAIPAETWNVELRFAHPYTAPTGQMMTQTASAVVWRSLGFVDGQTHEIVVDAAAFRRARLRGVITLDDRPFAGTARLVGRKPADAGWHPEIGVMCDAEGRFDAWLPVGTWKAAPAVKLRENEFASVEAPETAELSVGAVVDATFRARTARASVRVTGPDGAPAAGISMTLYHGERAIAATQVRTDDEGFAEVVAFAGTFQLRTLPRDWVGRVAVPAEVAIGTVTLPGEEIDLRLPAGW